MGKSIVAQIVALNKMPIGKLRQRWEELLGVSPPSNYSRKQLIARIAYRIQELVYGSLSGEALEKFGDAGDVPSGKLPKTGNLAGTRFVREWQGKRIEVTALESGFDYAGKRYRSLSAIASEITGTKWNGHKFFGIPRKQERS